MGASFGCMRFSPLFKFEYHLSDAAFSKWLRHPNSALVQVRQTCFVSLLDSLAAHGACGSESRRLRGLIDQRSSAARAQKAAMAPSRSEGGSRSPRSTVRLPGIRRHQSSLSQRDSGGPVQSSF